MDEDREYKISEYKRKAVFSEVGEFCYLSGEHDYIEVVEWKNQDGFDVDISNKNTEYKFSMTWGQFELLKRMVAIIQE